VFDLKKHSKSLIALEKKFEKRTIAKSPDTTAIRHIQQNSPTKSIKNIS
jgi:hypothetical protein